VVNLPKLKEASFFREVGVGPGSPFYVCVLESEEGRRTILKMGTPKRVRKDVEGYELILDLFPWPQILSVDNWGIEYEFFNGSELFQLIREDNRDALSTYNDYIERTKVLWSKNVRLYGEEKTIYDHAKITTKTLNRISGNLERTRVGFDWFSPLLINGNKYPSLRETFGLAKSMVRDPERIVLDPGDANGSNILVAGDRSWVLIDYERAGWYDPAYIIARQTGQWDLTVKDPNEVEIVVSGNTLSYQTGNLELLPHLKLEAMMLGDFLSKSFGDNDWRCRTAYYQLSFMSRMAVLSSSRFYCLLRQRDLSKVVLARAVEGFYQLINV